MKNNYKYIVSFICCIIVLQVFSQDTIAVKNYAFEPDKVAKEAVAKIVKYTGLTANFVVIQDKDITTAIAYIKNNKRYIAYNPKFIEKLNIKTDTYWAAVSVLAHEIGHHLSGHTLLKNASPGNELIADNFSGFILFQMGSTLKEAKTALSIIGHEMDTTNHPPQSARLIAIEEGWMKSKSLRNTNAYQSIKEKKDTVSHFVYKCSFYGDKNIYFIDDENNIIWYNNSGKPIIIGKKKPSTTNKFDWIYNYLDNIYGIDFKGKIWKETTYGAMFIVGEVDKLPKSKP